MFKMKFPLLAVVTCLHLAGLHAQNTAPAETQRKILIVVENRADASLNDKVAALEDLVSSRVAGKGFSVVSPNENVNAMKTSPANSLDAALSENSSALRLAQNLNVDFILIPAITSYGTEKKSYTGNGVQTLNVTHRLRVSYKIVEAGAGGAVRGGTVVSESTTRDTGNLQTDSTDTFNSLLDDAADQLAAAVVQNARALPATVAQAAMVNFHIACTMTDPRQQPVVVSAFSISSDNKLVVTNQPVVVQPLDVTVELDGVALGSAPGDFKALPGLHKIRLSREGFDDWTRTINVYDGQTLRVALQMSTAGYARWTTATAFLSQLDNDRKRTDAEAKQIEGLATFLSESHYRVDTKENLHINKSLY